MLSFGSVSLVIRWLEGVLYHAGDGGVGVSVLVRLSLESTVMVVTRPAGSVIVLRWPDVS